MKMLNSDHEPHITGTPMPHGKPQIQIGCGDSMRDQGDMTRNQFVCSVYAKSTLLDSNYESIPKVFAGQPFFITHSTISLNPTRLGRQPIPGFQPNAAVPFPASLLSLICANKVNPGTMLDTSFDTSKTRASESLGQRRERAAGRRCNFPSGSIQTGCPSLSQSDRG